MLAISGVPFFSGFSARTRSWAPPCSSESPRGYIFLLLLITAGLTSFYMFRVVFLTFTGKPRDHDKYDHAHESPW